MQNELDIPDPCPGAVYVLQSLRLLFKSSLFICHIPSLHIVHSLRVEVSFKISQIAQNLLKICLEFLVLSNRNKSSESGFHSFLLPYFFLKIPLHEKWTAATSWKHLCFPNPKDEFLVDWLCFCNQFVWDGVVIYFLFFGLSAVRCCAVMINTCFDCDLTVCVI